jgi:hypothetical protein
VVVGAKADGCVDGLAIAERLAAGDTEAAALDVTCVVAVFAGTLGTTFVDAAVAALGAADGGGCATTSGAATADVPGPGAASGDAEVAVLVALAAGDGCADALAVGAALAVELDADAAGAKALTGTLGFPEGLGAGVSAAFVVVHAAACVARSSPLPKMLACTAAATLDAERTIATATAEARDRRSCLGPSTALAVCRRVCFRLATFVLFT